MISRLNFSATWNMDDTDKWQNEPYLAFILCYIQRNNLSIQIYLWISHFNQIFLVRHMNSWFVKKFWSFSIQKSIRALYENFCNNINRKDFGKNPGTLIEFPESPSESWDLWDHMSELLNTLNILLEFEQFIHQSLIILISS